MSTKPPFRIPSMEEVRSLPWNGYTAVSTFSGCGGSSTGYRMAGFRVLWASEFIDAARESYLANSAPYTVVDGRDIRQVKAEEILAATKLKKGELDLFDGSPPCSSFSMVGTRDKDWGKVKAYSDKSQRTDDLFFEYVRLLRGLMPKTFVAENVAGLVSGTAKGYFLEILQALKDSGYRVSCRILDAKWLGVPQSRQRAIFVGVREDLGMDPVHPQPLPYFYSIRDALPDICAVHNGSLTGVKSMETILKRGGFARGTKANLGQPIGAVMANGGVINGIGGVTVSARNNDVIYDTAGQFSDKLPVANGPCPTVTASNATHLLVRGDGSKDNGTATNRKPDGIIRRKFSIPEIKTLCGFPSDFILTGTYAQQWERCGRSVPPVMMSHIAAAIRTGILDRVKPAKPSRKKK